MTNLPVHTAAAHSGGVARFKLHSFADPAIHHIWYNLRQTEMKRFRHKHLSRQICRHIAVTLLAFVAVVPPLAARAEKANVFLLTART